MDLILEFLQGLNIWWWLGLAGVLLIGEVITGTTYLLWPATAASITGVLTLPFIGIDWPIQLLVFSVISVALLYLGDRYVKPMLESGSESGLNTRATYLVGERVKVVAAFSGGRGRVQHGDDSSLANVRQVGQLTTSTQSVHAPAPSGYPVENPPP